MDKTVMTPTHAYRVAIVILTVVCALLTFCELTEHASFGLTNHRQIYFQWRYQNDEGGVSARNFWTPSWCYVMGRCAANDQTN